MNGQYHRRPIVQILGWKDRLTRIIIGTIMVSVSVTVMTMNLPIWLGDESSASTSVSVWYYVVLLLSIYPFWTAMAGWDPIYAAFKIKTCRDNSERNPCGTLPYQLDAAMGHHPIPDSDIEHSLDSAHHENGHQKRHASAAR